MTTGKKSEELANILTVLKDEEKKKRMGINGDGRLVSWVKGLLYIDVVE